MDESFDLEKNLSDRKDGSKQVTLNCVDKNIKIIHKMKKYSHIGREL